MRVPTKHHASAGGMQWRYSGHERTRRYPNRTTRTGPGRCAARCPDCGFDAGGTAGRRRCPGSSTTCWPGSPRRLADPERPTRPAPAVWSTTEYACHVRDVCDVFDGRLHAMLSEPDPLFANWDQDATALERQYRRSRARSGRRRAGRAAAHGSAPPSAASPAEQWARPGRRSNGSVFTVETLVQYFAHDLVHHAHDIGGPAQRLERPAGVTLISTRRLACSELAATPDHRGMLAHRVPDPQHDPPRAGSDRRAAPPAPRAAASRCPAGAAR